MLSIEESGQMLWVGFEGIAAADPGVQDLRRQAEAGRVGGCMLSHYNVVSPGQVQALVAAMHAWSTPHGFIVGVDQEGGAVQRLPAQKGFRASASAQALAEAGDLAAAEASFSALAEELATCGFDINFAPVVDLALAPAGPAIGARGRSFGAEPEAVVQLARRFIEAHRRHGVRTSLKHFPGHGSAGADSHRGLVDVTACWQEVELAPYRALIASGHADSIMTAHIMHRGLDPVHPASLSPTLLRQQLRQQLHYDGAVISDELQMGAVKSQYDLRTIIRLGLGSGTDVLLFAKNGAAYGRAGFIDVPTLYSTWAEIWREAVGEGRIEAAQLAASTRRVQALRAH